MSNAVVGSGPRYVDAELLKPVVQSTDAKAVVEVYTQAQVSTCETLVDEAKAVAITDLASCHAAERTLLQLHDALKVVEARRVELKKPLTQTGKAIDEIAGKLGAPMDVAKRDLQTRIIGFQRAERERAVAAEAEARRVREAAEAEARRRHAEEVAAAQAKADAEAKELAEVLGEPVVVEPVAVAPLPAPAPTPRAAAPAPSAVTSRSVKRVEITDASKIPYAVGDTVLMHPDIAALKRVLSLGIELTGARLVDDEQLAVAGRRS